MSNQKASMTLMLGLSLIFSGNLLAYGGDPHAVDTAEDKAKAALESLRVAYVQGNQEHFFKRVDERPNLNYTDLKFNVSRHLTDSSQIDLLIFTDHVLRAKNKVTIKTHWQKRHVNNHTGGVEKQQGQAEFLFKVTDEAHLIDIHGNDPF